jgi:voltage-gated potassium channel
VDPARRLRIALFGLAGVITAGTVGYVILGLGVEDALYQTVTTVTTVGFREVRPFDSRDKAFTMVLIVVGVGTVLYTFSLLLETLVEGHLRDIVGRRRVEKDLARAQGHAVICGWGRVGRAVAAALARGGQQLVVLDHDAARLEDCPHPYLVGDVTDDQVLEKAGVRRAAVLVSSLSSDADSLYKVLSARALAPDLVIIARSRTDAAEAKFVRAGANRVVNPQRIGGDRIAAAALQPHVVDFLDVVMHDEGLEFRLEEVLVEEGSPLAGATLADSRVTSSGAIVLALRSAGGTFRTDPAPGTAVRPGDVAIVVGTPDQVSALRQVAAGEAR